MKKVGKVLGLALAASCVMGMATGCNEKSDVERIQEKGNLVVGITVYEPMDYIGADGEWTGFDAELANLFGEELGVDVKFDIITWSQKVTELNSYSIDCVWNGMTASADLGQEIDFSVSYARNTQVAVVLNTNTTLTTTDAIKSAKIAVENGSAGKDIAENEIKGTNINPVTAQVDALLEVKAGTSDVAIIDYTMAKNVVGVGDYENLKIVSGLEYGNEVFAVGLRKDSDLQEKLNAFFKKYYNNGKIAELAEKYNVSIDTEALGNL